PPSPLATVGKAHFRSAAFGGAPHFVRRKNAAKAAFFCVVFIILAMGLVACSEESGNEESSPTETNGNRQPSPEVSSPILESQPEQTIEELGLTIVAAGIFWEDWWNMRGAFARNHIDGSPWHYWTERPYHPRSRGFNRLLPSSGFETITDIALHLQNFYTDAWINRELFGSHTEAPAESMLFGEPWAFEEYDGILYVVSERAGYIRPDWTTARHRLISQENNIARVETAVRAYDNLGSGDEMPTAIFRIEFENGRIESGIGRWEWHETALEGATGTSAFAGFYAPFEDYMLFVYRPEDVVLTNFDALVYMPHPALAGVDIQGEDVLIGATRTIHNISLILIENIWDDAKNQDGFTVTESFLIAEALLPSEVIIINGYVGLGSLPWSGITFTTAPGERHFFAFNHDNSDSPNRFLLLDITGQMLVG
ncbi:MAG: hypothetical protein FWF79_06075, partial [Defluviitaleaceae bacterium]|nr:hypothetical protein [Defluviitaleaceae bacterium]